MLHLLSTIVIILIGFGLYYRKRSMSVHLRFMVAAFIVDLGLVLYIEGARHAVERVASGASPLVLFHASVSAGVVALYVAMIILGWKIFVGKDQVLNWHKSLGIAFCVLRALNYVTSYWI